MKMASCVNCMCVFICITVHSRQQIERAFSLAESLSNSNEPDTLKTGLKCGLKAIIL